MATNPGLSWQTRKSLGLFTETTSYMKFMLVSVGANCWSTNNLVKQYFSSSQLSYSGSKF